jgi:hypothetical protein
MNDKLYKLHMTVGLKAGREKTCGTKRKFATEEIANKAAEKHNEWIKRNHDVEAYPCCFCNGWHIGKIIPGDILQRIAK